MALTQAQIQTAYQNVLQRAPSAGELNSYFSASQSGALSDSQVYTAIITSPEASRGTFSVVRFYQAAFGRVPDQGGLDQQVDTYNVNGMNLKAIGAGFTQSLEFTNRYGTEPTVTVAYLQALYVNVLGRTGSSQEIQGWLDAVNTPGSGYSSRADVLFGFAQSGEFIQASNTGVVNFLTGAAQGQGNYTGPLQTTGNNGQTLALTTGVDNLLGTGGNDAFSGVVDFTTPANSTLNVADTINGGLGTDSLSVTVSGNAAGSLPAANITNIENFFLREVGGTAGDYNFAAVAGEQQVWSDRSTDAVTFTGVGTSSTAGTAATIGLKGDGSTVLGNVSFTTTTLSDSVSIAIDGGVGAAGALPTITNTGAQTATSATISSTGAANKVGAVDFGTGTVLTALNVNAATNLTATLVDGDYVATGADLKVSGAAASVDLGTAGVFKTVDASGLTAGGLTIVLDAVNTSFKGGQGNDVVTTVGLNATTAGAVNAGAGTADTLVVAGATDVNNATKGAVYTGFETLRVGNSQDVSFVAGITAVEVVAATDAVISGLTAAQAGAITVKGDQTNSLTLTLANATGTTDVVSLALKSDTAASNVDVAGLKVTGVETLNIVGTTGAVGDANAITFGAGGADQLTKVNVSGTANFSLSGTQTAKAVTLVSTATGIATVSGDFVNASSITTGTGNDVITLGSGFATYSTGAGTDTFNGTAAQLNTAANFNTLNGGDGVDTLNITGGATLALDDNNLSKITNVEKIVVASTVGNTQSITTGGFVDTNFKASGFDLTTTSTTGTIAINANTFTGAATLASTSTTGAQTITTGVGADKVTTVSSTGAITLATGDGADTVSVTHSGAAGGDTVSTGAGNDSITLVGSAGNTVVTSINAGTGTDTIVLDTVGTSTDTIVIAAGDSTLVLATADKITNFTAASDSLKVGITGVATANTGNYVESAAVSTDFNAALSAANAALNTLNTTSAETQLFSFQADATNGYVFQDSNSDGVADQVIVLTGVTAAGFSAANLIA